jgi:hypothetical protein
MFSETRYAMNEDLRVAYRASPEGPRDIVVVFPSTNCEVFPELPPLQGWVEAMTSLGDSSFSTSRTCYATWSVGGESRTGPIEGGNRWDYRIGSSVDVRVSGGTAYTAATVPSLEILGGVLQIALGVGGLGILRRRRNR